MLKILTIDRLYQFPIDAPPPQVGNLYENACRGDKGTMEKWREQWLSQQAWARDNIADLKERSIGQLFQKNWKKPAIVLGSGPSLKESIPALKENQKLSEPIPTVSCLHNFGFFEDEGVHADYYLSLDSGDIVLKDVVEGREKDPEYYWEKTKDHTLLAMICSHPELFKKWKGKILFFNMIVPDRALQAELDKILTYRHYISAGGNALGGCLYIAKAVMGSDPIIYVGADFCFSYDNQFHSYQTHYDTLGQYVVWPDVFGIPRKTWPSYLSFKYFFDHIAMNVPGHYINCSEGLMGAYVGGNLRHFAYMPLEVALIPYQMGHRIFLEDFDPKTGQKLNTTELKLAEVFKSPDYEKDIVLF